MTLKPHIALLVLAAFVPAAQAMAAQTVKVTGAWCRAAPAGALSGGCYLALTAGTDDRLLGVSTPAADHGEVHTMSMDGGIMRMRQLTEGLALPAGVAVTLKPGGEHLMIIGPRQTLKAGGVVSLTLRFAKAAPLTVAAPVLAAPPPVTTGMEHR